jgi:Predicted membrane protein
MHRTLIALAAVSLVASTASAQDTKAEDEWYKATGKTCSTTDVTAAKSVEIKTDKYDAATMISPDSAKLIALCLVPGQVTDGEMNLTNDRINYTIDIIPDKKMTHTKVVVDAETGAVLSSKQFGGARGLAGWVRESFEHKENKKP